MGVFNKLFGNVLFDAATSAAKVTIRGAGATSATSSLIVSSSTGVGLNVKDDARVYGGGVNERLLIGDSIQFPVGSKGIIGADGATGIFPYFGAGTFRFANWINNYEITWQYPNKTFWIQETTGGTAQASAHLQVDSTTQGFLPPRMTTAQKNAIASPAEGLMVYDTDLKRPCFYNATSWITL